MKQIGFVGVGKQAQCAHLPNYLALPDCRVVGVADADEELAGRVAVRYVIQEGTPPENVIALFDEAGGG